MAKKIAKSKPKIKTARRTTRKAVSTPRGLGASMTPVSPGATSFATQSSVSITNGVPALSTGTSPYDVRYGYGGQPNPPGQNFSYTGQSWFGPLPPLRPIAPPEVAGREWDFIPGYNLTTQPRAYEPIDFQTLRDLSESYDPLRLVIERRKDQLTRLAWQVRLKHEGKGRRPTVLEISQADKNRIDAMMAFFKKPDGEVSFRQWFRSLIDDLLVIDAPTIYCQRSRVGGLQELRIIDGGTIKRVIDDWGRTPRPINWKGIPFVWNGQTVNVDNYMFYGFKQINGIMYPPAYQQVLKGLPAVDYTTVDMIYRPHNLRPGRVYGFSPVEQIVTTVSIALRRQFYQLEYYREGNQPDAIIGLPESWTPQQIMQFQDYWDGLHAGNLSQRRRAKFIASAGRGRVNYVELKEPPLKNMFDEWLSRVVCLAFSYPPSALVSLSNRSVAQEHARQAEEEGIGPYKNWAAELFNDIIENEFGHKDLEFAWIEEDEVDQEKQSKILTSYAGNGVLTLNEARERLGEVPHENPAANELMVKTGNGYVPVSAWKNTTLGPSTKGLGAVAVGPDGKPLAASGTDGAGRDTGGTTSRDSDADKARKFLDPELVDQIDEGGLEVPEMEFYIVRHGETEAEGVVHSWGNVQLSEKGREEIRKLAGKMKAKGIEVDVIISSDLDRTRDTAKIIAEVLEIEHVHVNSKLRSWNLGQLIGLENDDVDEAIKNFVTKKPNKQVPGGESFNQFLARGFDCLRDLVDEYIDEKIMVVTHHRFERFMKAWIAAGMPASHAISLDTYLQRGERTGREETVKINTTAIKNPKAEQFAQDAQTEAVAA